MKLELRSVRIKNCGPIDDSTIDFCDQQGKPLPVCVIGGANGSGKTTVLEVIYSLFDNLLNGGRFSASVKIQMNTYLQVDSLIKGKEFSLMYGRTPSDVILGKGEQRGFVDLKSVATDFTEAIIEMIELSKTPVRRILRKNRSPFTTGDQMPSILYFPYNRSLEPVIGDQIQKEALLYRFAQRIETVRQFKGSLNSHLVWLDYAEPEEFKKIQQFLNNLDLDGKTFHISRKDLAVIVQTKNGQEHLLHELSSGEQNLLIILIELYRRLLPGSVVLIDEIENSLHPAFQHRLAQGLLKLQKEIPYQLIVTTHSPTFVEIFGAENTRILTPF